VFQDPYISLDPRQSAADAIDEVLRLHSDMAQGGSRSRSPGPSPPRRLAADPDPSVLGCECQLAQTHHRLAVTRKIRATRYFGLRFRTPNYRVTRNFRAIRGVALWGAFMAMDTFGEYYS
jgi:ABC-type dipeptide/oligopeptide/nickel transport system ATPase component